MHLLVEIELDQLIIIFFSLEPRSRDWNVTKIIYKPKETTTSVSTPATQHRSQSQVQDHLREFSNLLNPQRNQPQQMSHTHHSLPSSRSIENHEQDRIELHKAIQRANEMEKRAKEAEQNLSDVLQQLVQANDKVVALKTMVEDAQQKAAVLQQEVLQAQEEKISAGSAQGMAGGISAVQRALDVEEQAATAKMQLAQAEEKIISMETQLSKANDTILHLQEDLSAIKKHASEKEQQVTQVEQRATQLEQRASQAEQRAAQAEQSVEEVTTKLAQMEIRAIEAEARAHQAQRGAQLSQDRAFNSEMRAREEERRRLEAEQEVRDANARLERAERRASFVNRGDERIWALERGEIDLTDTEIGRGGWAVVKIAKFRGTRVAAKCIHNNILSDHNRALFVREMNMAARLRHPNLVQFIGATIHGEPLILMELMPTTLRLELRHGPPNRDQILAISKDIAKALNYMHLMKPVSLVHRDISSANVLLEPSSSNSWKVKLSDYGSVNFVQRTVSAGPGNPTYAAPEANNPDMHSPKMDVYSYGVLLSEMCSGRFPDVDHSVLVERVQDQQMAGLIGRCLANERDRRPTMAAILTTLNAL